MNFGVSQSLSVPYLIYFIMKNNELYIVKTMLYDRMMVEIPYSRKINKFIKDTRFSKIWP